MLFSWSAFLLTSATSKFALLFLLTVSHFDVECQQVPISQNKVSICADEYKVSSYTMECQVGLGIVIRGAIEVFARQSTGVFPDCFAQGYNYNYSKPFLDYCDAKNICTLSSAFLDENRLFDPEPYYLPDKSFYLKPFRIDVFYDCSSSPLLPTIQLPIRVNQITTTTTTTSTTTTKKPTTTTTATTTTQTTTNSTLTSTTTILTTSTITTTKETDNTLTTTSKDNSKLISSMLTSNNNTTNDWAMKNMKNSEDLSTSTSKIIINNSPYSSLLSSTSTSTINTLNNSLVALKNTNHLTRIEISNEFTNRVRKNTTTSSRQDLSSRLDLIITSTNTATSNGDEWTRVESKIEPKLKKINISEQPEFELYDDDQNDFERPKKTTKQFRPISSVVFLDEFNYTKSINATKSATDKARPIINSTLSSKLIVDRQPNHSNLNSLKSKFKSYKDINSITTSSLSPVLTTTRIENLGGDNTTTDRTVMIVLIVLGAIFFLIIIAIVVLICLRRRNQKRMDKEFFRSEKNGGGASSLNNNASSASISNMGGVKEKVPFTITDTAFIEVSQSTSMRNYENSTETHGTYRSRNNNGYDSTADEPNSMSRVRLTTASIAAETSLPRQQQQVVNPGPKNRPRVDHDEYWRTNI